MGMAWLGIGSIVVVFICCITWATRGQPLSESTHEDEHS